MLSNCFLEAKGPECVIDLTCSLIEPRAVLLWPWDRALWPLSMLAKSGVLSWCRIWASRTGSGRKWIWKSERKRSGVCWGPIKIWMFGRRHWAQTMRNSFHHRECIGEKAGGGSLGCLRQLEEIISSEQCQMDGCGVASKQNIWRGLALVPLQKSFVLFFGAKLLHLTNEPWKTGSYQAPKWPKNRRIALHVVSSFGSERQRWWFGPTDGDVHRHQIITFWLFIYSIWSYRW